MIQTVFILGSAKMANFWWNMQDSIEIFCIAEQQQIAEGIVLINTDYLCTQGNQ